MIVRKKVLLPLEGQRDGAGCRVIAGRVALLAGTTSPGAGPSNSVSGIWTDSRPAQASRR